MAAVIDRTIHSSFEEQVSRIPGAPALAFDGAELSYAELNARANRVAHYLREFGAGPETLVGLFLERSLETVVALIGVLKAGAAYVPTDPGYPPDRISFLLGDCRAPVVLSQESLLDRLQAVDAEVICLDRDAASIGAESPENPRTRVGPLNLAYVIYTSGSSGRPKGVAVPHRGVCNLARFQQRVFRIGPQDRVLQFAAVGFDASVWDITLALLSGALLYLPGEARRRWRLGKVVEESEVTIATLTPSVLATLNPSECPSIKQLIVTGEACPPALAREWSKGRSFYNGYGPTETSICASICRIAGLPGDAVTVPIGRAITNTRIYVVDPDLNPLPAGSPGELYISGANVTRGYLRRPGLTAEHFLPDPIATEPGARMYRSGDLGRYRADGELEFLGRIDDQVKVRGIRIEPGEVEAALLDHPGLREAIVVADDGEGGDRKLIAYVAARARAAPSAARLKEHLSTRLPEYMIPNEIMLLETFPTTPNGKIDRKALARRSQPPAVEGAPATEAPAADDRQAGGRYDVVVNHEEQYSIWPDGRQLPNGWTRAGMAGSRETCLSYVDETWLDLRPARIRKSSQSRSLLPAGSRRL
jgi:amino acid adenylation domain-containing protein